jgi:hypothetical protein
MLTGDWKVTDVPGTTGYLEGVNWLSVARSYRDVIGVQRDGSLWVSERPETLPIAGPMRASPSPRIIQLGQDSDWKAVAVSGNLAYLLKTNGTLWRLGTNRAGWKNWPGLRAFAPERLGSDADWAGISRMEFGRLSFHKMDGRVWTFPTHAPPDPSDPELIRLDADTILDRTPYFDRQKAVASSWVPGPSGRSFRLGVGEDGSLRVVASWGQVSRAGGRQRNWGFIPENIPLGNETNWLALAHNRNDVVALKTDGTLWKLDFPADPITRPERFSATPLSRHSDWVALVGTMDGTMALAADGSLWLWAMEERHLYPATMTPRPLLRSSRRPQPIGNLFGQPTP